MALNDWAENNGTARKRTLGHLTAEQKTELLDAWAEGKWSSETLAAWLRTEGFETTPSGVAKYCNAKGVTRDH